MQNTSFMFAKQGLRVAHQIHMGLDFNISNFSYIATLHLSVEAVEKKYRVECVVYVLWIPYNSDTFHYNLCSPLLSAYTPPVFCMEMYGNSVKMYGNVWNLMKKCCECKLICVEMGPCILCADITLLMHCQKHLNVF